MKLKAKSIIALLFAALPLPLAAQTITPECISRAKELTRQMTLDEKLDYIGGSNEFYIRAVPRLGIPEIRMADGPQGVRNDTKSTLYPCGAAAAATWNRSLVRQMGVSLGRDSRARGVHILLGPGVNIARMPLCGRNFEYMGEDPYLSSRMAVEYIKGVQSQGVMATVKHFACNNEEYDRHHISSDVDPRTLNEIYFPAFKAAVREAGVGAVMTSYNLLNGVHTAQSSYLIGETLRGKWGFQGMVMSDWTSVYSPLQAAQSGIDIEMPQGYCLNRDVLLPMIENGVILEADIDSKVEHILSSLIAFGFLDRDQKDSGIPEDDSDSDRTSLEIARESIVMLENRGDFLPLEGRQKIVLMGPYSCSVPFGGGSGSVEPIRTVPLYDALKEIPGYEVEYLDTVDGNESKLRSASAIILSLGFDKDSEKENHDRSFSLPETQLALIDKVSKLNRNVAVIVCAGGSVEIASWRDKVSSILWGWYYGQRGGTALAEILSGKSSPSGRLPVSFERKLEDNPCFNSYRPDNGYMKRSEKDGQFVTYKEGIFMGYRGYDRLGTAPLYPFGYGLTYGKFDYSDLSVKVKGDDVKLEFTLKNSGRREAAEVVQVYVGQKNPLVPRPLRELKQFAKVKLKPGESRRISLNLGKYAFTHYESGSWTADSDVYTIEVGANERDIRLSDEVKYVNATDRKNEGLSYMSAEDLGIYGHPHESDRCSLSRVSPGTFDFADKGINEYARQSTGLFLCFRTDSPLIRARWTTTGKNAGVNMSAIGQKGLDLYIKKDGRWVFAGVGTPDMTGDFTSHESTIVSGMDSTPKDCLLYLPIFDRIHSLEIGVAEGSLLETLPNPFRRNKVICAGSSITHGAAASRAGMTWPSRLSRDMGWLCPNLGFSGKFRLERSYAEFLSGTQADAIIIDAFSNPSAEEIRDRFDTFLDILRAAHPTTPIIFLNTERRESRNFSLEKEKFEAEKQLAAREVVRRRMKTDRNLYFIDSEDFIGHDHNATADGTHPTDLGFDRMLNILERRLRKILR